MNKDIYFEQKNRIETHSGGGVISFREEKNFFQGRNFFLP